MIKKSWCIFKASYSYSITIIYFHLPKISNSKYIVTEWKVFGISKFWQEVNYNFVYLDKIDRELWDSTYIVMIKSVQETKNDYEYFRELQRFCALLKDGHTRANPKRKEINTQKNIAFAMAR